MNPKTAVLSTGGTKSLTSRFLNPSSNTSRSEIGSANVIATHPIRTPQKLAANVSSGSIRTHANTRVATRYLYGSTADASIPTAVDPHQSEDHPPQLQSLYPT